MANKNSKEAKRQKIRHRIRKKIKGTATQPRLCIKKTNTAVYLQLIDDTKGHTLLALDSRKQAGKRMEVVEKMAEELVRKAMQKKIYTMCYDRSGYLFHGVVKKTFQTIQRHLAKK